MAERTQEPKRPLSQEIELEPEESTKLDCNALLHDTKDAKVAASTSFSHARKILSFSTIVQSLADFALSIVSIYFTAFAFMVYSRREQPVERPGNSALLEAAKYSPTLFPILFAAIVAKFLRALAAVRLERGVSISTMGHLLNSRTVFSALTTPFDLKTVNITTLMLILLWALSPLGSQAGLRVISTAPFYTNVTNNFTYLAFVSPFTNEGVGSASAEPLTAINAAFTAALASSPDSKASSQDQFGNIKIPVYEYLEPTSSKYDSPWREVPDTAKVLWSSITGLPVHGLPSVGTSWFTLNTGYMLANCKVSGQATNQKFMQSLANSTYWSGANFAIDEQGINSFKSFKFQSLDIEGDIPPKPLTVAMCNVTMSYVMVQITCKGVSCRTLAVRPSTNLASHTDALTSPRVSGNPTEFTPLNGLGQPDAMYINFFRNFVNSTNPAAACDTVLCSTSAIEGYLAKPESPYSFSGSNPSLWTFGDQLISQRFTQLLNTYWIDSIAPFAIAGNFSLAKPSSTSSITDRYNTDSSLGTIETQTTVVKCNYIWFGILLLASIVLLLVGFAATVLNMFRRGPNILDSFTSLLRDNPYCAAAGMHKSSMEDAPDQSRRLRNVMVRLGDVRPDEDVGYVALAVVDGSNTVQRLSPRRVYG